MEGDAFNSVQSRGVKAVYNVGKSTNIRLHDEGVVRDTKEKILGHKGLCLWFTGEYAVAHGIILQHFVSAHAAQLRRSSPVHLTFCHNCTPEQNIFVLYEFQYT